ncbi:hypothetical protein J1N35_006177 [Gossypium stocksii]|uniref:Uncharacterized protein n=1 Tax=Gossypium stocksii TaxID=47602 RepID=A0A9D4AHT8_9ROSI|nr:hypothetical protein J1N35_006177 [Gossypium stocksii]
MALLTWPVNLSCWTRQITERIVHKGTVISVLPTPPPSCPTIGHPKALAKNLIMGQVKILKRGEDLKQSKSNEHVRFVKENTDVDLGSTDCLSSDPKFVLAQIRFTKSENNKSKVVPISFQVLFRCQCFSQRRLGLL